MDVFWDKQINIGKLHLNLCRNDGIARLIKLGSKKQNSFRFNRLGTSFSLVIRRGTRFLNVDWV